MYDLSIFPLSGQKLSLKLKMNLQNNQRLGGAYDEKINENTTERRHTD